MTLPMSTSGADQTSRTGDRSVSELLSTATTLLAEAGVSSPAVDVELLMGHVLEQSRGQVQLARATGAMVAEADRLRFETLVEERARRVPLQHLTGTAPFRHLELRVGPGVFVPRPETEHVVQLALDYLATLSVPHPRVVDLGTGSGAIAAAIASECPQAEVHAVEVSDQAAAWAAANCAPLGVTLHQRDLRDLPDSWEASFDVVISNPPYIPPGHVPTEVEVRDHDPELALYGGGDDGLEIPRAVVATAQRILVPGGWFILEHAEVQGHQMRQICEATPGLMDVQSHRDLTGRPRATSARTVEEYTP